MGFWARSGDSSDKSDWQPLKDHLSGVAEIAGCFGRTFGAEDLTRLAGLCHDLGKYSTEFQMRLEDPKVHVDHSTAGASLVFEKYGPVGRLLAYAIAGHHSGLPNGGGSAEADLFYRVMHKKTADYSGYAGEIDLPQRCGRVPVKLHSGNPGFSAAFFVRMMFSCLVDADYLDAERFTDPEKARLRGHSESLAVMEKRLMEHIRQISSNACPSLVNLRRAEVLHDCVAAAEQEPGLFTLTVPTGGAKTLSSLAFALKHALRYDLNRIIYVIPFTSIIEQNARVFRDAVGSDGVLEHHSNVTHSTSREDGLPTQTELAEDNWDMPLVVTTNVQFFESMFSSRPSRCRKIHNIARSVIVLDEAQMLPIDLLRPCVTAIQELVLNYGTTVVLCSATQPSLDGLFKGGQRPREIVRSPTELYRALRRVQVKNLGAVDNEEIARHIRGREQVLCIVNTRAHARQIFELLGKAEGHYHLSAAMCPRHRTKCLDEIRCRLSRGQTCRVISTQLIEAGVDVDFPVVLRAAAGIDSIAQAAGRCNREGKLECGEVFVFTPAGGEGMSHVWFKRTAAIASSILEESHDPLSLDAVKRYFNDLYFYEEGGVESGVGRSGLDTHGLMQRMEVGAARLDFPFRDICSTFKLIGDDTIGVVVPYDDGCRKVLKEVRFLGISRNRVRRLQPYTVSVRLWEYKRLREAGLLEDVNGLPALWDMSAYDGEAYGLIVPTGRATGGEAWIV